MMSLSPCSFLEGCKVLKPGYLWLWNTIDFTFDFTTIYANQINLLRCLNKLRIFRHVCYYWLGHLAMIVCCDTFKSAYIGLWEAVDLKLLDKVICYLYCPNDYLHYLNRPYIQLMLISGKSYTLTMPFLLYVHVYFSPSSISLPSKTNFIFGMGNPYKFHVISGHEFFTAYWLISSCFRKWGLCVYPS